jgi:GH18 family chitinase
MDTYYERAYLRWDSIAQASYLSIDMPGSSDDKFISYDSDIACQRKVKYAMTNGLGGVFIWELGGEWRPSAPIPDYLLQAIKAARFGAK